MDCSRPGSSVHGILQARILEGVAVSSSRGSSSPRDQTVSLALAGGFFITGATWEAHLCGSGIQLQNTVLTCFGDPVPSKK